MKEAEQINQENFKSNKKTRARARVFYLGE